MSAGTCEVCGLPTSAEVNAASCARGRLNDTIEGLSAAFVCYSRGYDRRGAELVAVTTERDDLAAERAALPDWLDRQALYNAQMYDTDQAAVAIIVAGIASSEFRARLAGKERPCS